MAESRIRVPLDIAIDFARAMSEKRPSVSKIDFGPYREADPSELDSVQVEHAKEIWNSETKKAETLIPINIYGRKPKSPNGTVPVNELQRKNP